MTDNYRVRAQVNRLLVELATAATLLKTTITDARAALVTASAGAPVLAAYATAITTATTAETAAIARAAAVPAAKSSEPRPFSSDSDKVNALSVNTI